MIKSDLSGVRIAAVACAVPKTSDDLSDYRLKFGGEAVDKFTAMTAVRERRVAAEEQTASDLAYAAAQYLLERESVNPQEIGACILVTQFPDYRIPATACVLHKRFGLSKDCLAFDVNLGCSGYVYGINIAASLMKTNGIGKCLLLAADTAVRAQSPEDRASCMLFGDAGAATLLELDADAKMYGSFRTDGKGFKAIITPAGAYRNRLTAESERTLWEDGGIRSDYDNHMNSTDVFSFSITEAPKQIRDYLAWRGKTVEDFDAFIMHQANGFILKQLCKKIKVSEDKMPLSMDRYGNTSSVSIPLTLCDVYGGGEGAIRAMFCGFGVGLSWGVIDTTVDTAHVYPIIETDDYYTEGSVSHD